MLVYTASDVELFRMVKVMIIVQAMLPQKHNTHNNLKKQSDFRFQERSFVITIFATDYSNRRTEGNFQYKMNIN